MCGYFCKVSSSNHFYIIFENSTSIFRGFFFLSELTHITCRAMFLMDHFGFSYFVENHTVNIHVKFDQNVPSDIGEIVI